MKVYIIVCFGKNNRLYKGGFPIRLSHNYLKIDYIKYHECIIAQLHSLSGCYLTLSCDRNHSHQNISNMTLTLCEPGLMSPAPVVKVSGLSSELGWLLCPLSDATPVAPALSALSTCAWLRGPAAAQPPKRQSSESLKINIYDGGYLSFYKRRGVAVVMQYIVATIIDPSQLLKFNTKVCQKCGSHF